jgi:hypothetical protein
MHRFVVLFIALLLPFQFVWGAAAAYCEHAATVETAKHFGHHEHVHTADLKADPKQVVDTKLVGDNDCGTCHATCSAIANGAPAGMPGPELGTRPVFPAAQRLPSALARAPDRPQWLRLA